MHTLQSHWRKITFFLPVAAVIAAAVFFFGGSGANREQAFATGGDELSGVTCTDVYVQETDVPDIGATALEFPLPLGYGPVGAIHVAMSITRTNYDSVTHATNGVGTTLNKELPGLIAGAAIALPNCAEVDKVVATVTSASAPTVIPDSDGLAGPDLAVTTYDLLISASGNVPETGMLVYWDSSVAAHRGFYQVVTTDGSTSATLRQTSALNLSPFGVRDLCNNTPPNGTGEGSLWSCIPVNKNTDLEVYAYGNGATTTSPSLLTNSTEPRAAGFYGCGGGPGTSVAGTAVPAPACTSFYDKGSGTTISVTCGPATGPPENPLDTTGSWTRLEIRTITSGNPSEKVPSYGWTQFFTDVTSKDCDNTADTRRSTTYNIVWSLDSAAVSREGAVANWDSDWDKDGCRDADELAAPQPVAVNGAGGRDAFNPYDCVRAENANGADGAYSVLVEMDDITYSNPNVLPGSFFRCRAVISGSSMPIYCYRDDADLDLNPDDAPGVKGDGYSGGIWPTGASGDTPAASGPYGDVNATHSVLTSTYDNVADTLELRGCLEDVDGTNPEGHVYWTTTTGTDISLLSGYGEIDVYINNTQGACMGGNPDGTLEADNAAIYIGIQADAADVATYDQDLDGMPNILELQNDSSCGRRDPFNRYDYYDVGQPASAEPDGVIDLFNDIVGVISNYEPDGYAPGAPAISGPGSLATYDRPSKMSGNSGTWNRDAPDGVVDLFNDISGVIAQYNPDGLNSVNCG